MTSKITAFHVWKEDLQLTRPYTIATKTIAEVENVFVRIDLDNGLSGWGSCNPDAAVAGESPEEAFQRLNALDKSWLVGRDIRQFQGILATLSARYRGCPGTLAALDIALHDAFCGYIGLPLSAWLGGRRKRMPTSVTIGIMPVRETLDLAAEYLGLGFTCIKVKLGTTPEEDLERLVRLREKLGRDIRIRVDFNQACPVNAVPPFYAQTLPLDIELFEQPTPPAVDREWRKWPVAVRRRIAADESLTDCRSAWRLLTPTPACGIFNIKLMKCGGIAEALRIAGLGKQAGISLMWGCNDESRISIAAALHAALSCPHTRYIDLDGSFDLARDVVKGGFRVENGVMYLTGRPGLGVVKM